MFNFRLLCAVVVGMLLGWFVKSIQGDDPGNAPTTVAGPAQPAASAQPAVSAASTANVIVESEAINFRKLAELRARLDEVKTSKAEVMAKTIAEVDAWLFFKDDEPEAQNLIRGAMTKLPIAIAADVQESLQSARKASEPKQRTAAIRRAESIVGLFPAPRDEAAQGQLDGLVASIKSTSVFLQDVQRLRYNQWALSRIQVSLRQFHETKGIHGVKDLGKLFLNDQDRRNLIRICKDALGPINPSHLEPAVADLYSHSYGLTRAMLKDNEELMLELAKSLTDPSLERKSPMDF